MNLSAQRRNNLEPLAAIRFIDWLFLNQSERI